MNADAAKRLILPVLVIVFGVSWLLDSLNVLPEVAWIWSLALATGGVLAFVFWGVTKQSVVVGPLLLAGAVLSVLRSLGHITLEVELPILVIMLGLGLLAAQVLGLPSRPVMPAAEREVEHEEPPPSEGPPRPTRLNGPTASAKATPAADAATPGAPGGAGSRDAG
ncbi:MAG: hypothetical protein ACFB21_09400 [Opitutales bacterium]